MPLLTASLTARAHPHAGVWCARRAASSSRGPSAHRAMASAASGLHKAEVFVHPSYGRAVRATERIPAGTVVLKERPFFALLPSDAITAEAAKAVAALRCEPSVPARMLAFCAAPEALRARILQLFDGGGPAQWPTAVPDSDTFPDKLVYSSDNTASVARAVASWLVAHSPSAHAFSADTLARAAVIMSLNAHACEHGADTAAVSTLFELSSKFAHSCDPNAYYNWCADTGELTHTTLRAIAPGEALTVEYQPCAAQSTPVRRHLLARGKFFVCGCALCAAPDPLAALPCPVCVPRDATGDGTLPLERVFVAPADARDWSHPTFIGLREHPLAVPDDGANPVENNAAAAAAVASPAAPPPAWRCATCGGAFSRRALARLLIPAHVRRPLPRSDTLSSRFGAARLLDVARWAECGAISSKLNLQAGLKEPESVTFFAAGGAAEAEALNLNTHINELAALVGTSHASITSLRLYRLGTALRGAFARGCVAPQPCSRAQLADEVRRLLGVRAGTAAATTLASALLADEVAALAATLRRAKRLAALTPKTMCQLTCVMAALGGLTDQNIARLLLDLLRDVARDTASGVSTEEELTAMQAMILAHVPFWTRGGGSGADAAA